MKIESKFMRGIASKLIKKAMRNKLGYAELCEHLDHQ